MLQLIYELGIPAYQCLLCQLIRVNKFERAQVLVRKIRNKESLLTGLLGYAII